jgi:Protein of unknown function (DUF742)
MTRWDDAWYDDDAGPLIRVYGRVGVGRAALDHSDRIDLSAMICTLPSAPDQPDLSSEQSTVLRLARDPISLSEVAVCLAMPVGAVQLLIAGMRDAGLVTVPRSRGGGSDPSPDQLQRLLSGLQSL